MATLTIRNLDQELKARLRVRAAEHGRSMEAEVRSILQESLSASRSGDTGLASRIHQRFSAVGGVDLEIPDRSDAPRWPDLER